jgi:hypothetical protein
MSLSLTDLEEAWLTGVRWTEAGNLVLEISDAFERPVEVIFYIITFLKVVSTNPRLKGNLSVVNREEIIEENQLWKLEEISDSSLIDELVYKEEWGYRLRQSFGNKYERTARTDDPDQQRHIVMLSDYIDLELLCARYEIKLVDRQPVR